MVIHTSSSELMVTRSGCGCPRGERRRAPVEVWWCPDLRRWLEMALYIQIRALARMEEEFVINGLAWKGGGVFWCGFSVQDSELLDVGRPGGFLVLGGSQWFPMLQSCSCRRVAFPRPMFACIVSWLDSPKTVESGVLSSRWVNGFFWFCFGCRGAVGDGGRS